MDRRPNAGVISRRALSLTVVLGVVLGVAPGAGGQEGRQYTEIAGTGQTLYKIAIPPLLDGGGATEMSKMAQQVMSRDLTLIGLFKVLDPKGFLADLAREGTGIDAETWANVGAQAVIKGRTSLSGRSVTYDLYLYDVGKGTSPVLHKTLSGKRASARRLVHTFGNEVVRYYTGEKGIFTTKIAFAATRRKSKRSQIYVMDYDGYGVYKVSRTGQQNLLPSWSPSGALAYTAYMWRNPDLYVVSGSGGRASRIAKYPGLNVGAAWSPSGHAIALTLSKDGNAEIYLISPSGSLMRRLTNNQAIDTSPTWSPDGGSIAFVSNRGGNPQIYVMSASGGGARRLTYQGNYNQEPDWSPRKDRPLVAFTGRDEGGNYDIFTVNVQTGEMKRLTQGQGSNKSPTWAPNGRLVAFTSSRGGIWVTNEDGFNQHQLYRGGAQTPRWSR